MPAGKENARKRNAPAESAGPRDVITIEVIDGPALGNVYDKQADRITIGRTRSSHVYIKDPAVSQKHGAITWNGERWQIVDLGSSNGTTVNDDELEEDGEPFSLSDGDVVMIGTDTTVKISITPAPSGSNARAKPAKVAKKAAPKPRGRPAKATKAKAAPEPEPEPEQPEVEPEPEPEVEPEPEPVVEPEREEEAMTVEGFLTATSDALIEEVRAKAEEAAAALRRDFASTASELRAECAAAR